MITVLQAETKIRGTTVIKIYLIHCDVCNKSTRKKFNYHEDAFTWADSEHGGCT